MTPQSAPPTAPRQSKLKPRLLGLALILGSILLAGSYIGWFAYTLSWPTVNAVVTSSNVTHNGDKYSLSVAYEYTVNEQKYTGAYTQTSNSVLTRLTEGSTVTVSYSPSLPQLSYHDRSPALVIVLIPLCCLLPFGLIVIGTTFLPDQSITKIYNIKQ